MLHVNKLFMVVLLLFSATASLAAPKQQVNNDIPLGTWTQQGTDINGDGVLSGIESKTVFFYDEGRTLNPAPKIIFTLHVKGGCPVNIITCEQMPTESNPSPPCKSYLPFYDPGYRARISSELNMGALGVNCAYDDEECAFTVSDVRP